MTPPAASFGLVAAQDSGPALAVEQEGGRDVVVDVTGAVGPARRLPDAGRVTGHRRDRAGRWGRRPGRCWSRSTERHGSPTVNRSSCRSVLRVGTAAAAAGSATSGDGPISLGTASVEQLDTIEGIGPVTAGDIIEFRDQHGGLSSIEQLDEISGIGPATMEALRGRLEP